MPRRPTRQGGVVCRLAVIFAAIAGAPVLLPAQSSWGIAPIDGDFYLTDLGRGRVVRLDGRGSIHVVIDDVHCHNLASDHRGRVHGEAVGEGAGGTGGVVSLWRIAGGRVERVMGPASEPEPGLWIARDAAGNSYGWMGSGERLSRIFVRTPAGDAAVLAGEEWGLEDGSASEARFAAVGAVAASADGTLYVTDSGHLRRVSRGGEVETLARDVVSVRTGGLPGDFGLFNHSVGLAVGAGDTVLIADAYNRRGVRWRPGHGTDVFRDQASWLSRITGGGLGWSPAGIAFDGGDILVLEAFSSPRFLASLIGTPRLWRIRPDGSSERLATFASRPLRIAAAVVPVALALLLMRSRATKRA
ncbi:MAG TPA: hypothetical protein VNA04_11855 [Thermoanaerobaculia bacterium]|nr:hypothetical protein [Thermoanaerobaculia bacterium]